MRESMSALPPEDPGVFAAAALRGINDERPRLQSDTRQTAGHDGNFLAVKEAVRTKIDVAPRHALRSSVVRRNNREGHNRLRDVVARFSENSLAESFDFGASGAGAHQHAVAAGFSD